MIIPSPISHMIVGTSSCEKIKFSNEGESGPYYTSSWEMKHGLVDAGLARDEGTKVGPYCVRGPGPVAFYL